MTETPDPQPFASSGDSRPPVASPHLICVQAAVPHPIGAVSCFFGRHYIPKCGSDEIGVSHRLDVAKMTSMAPGSFELSGRDVHVWTLRTGAEGAVAAKLEAILSPDERDRAARFLQEQPRQSFVVTRGVLRCLLGCYLGVHAASVRFSYSSNGKPGLASAEPIKFNTTHSNGMAAFAFTRGCQLGIDLELIRPLTEIQSLAHRFFCPEETAEIMSLAPAERVRAFFCCWTRKEAYIKAIGDGLSVPLNKFRVTVRPNEPARFVRFGRDTNDAQTWTLQDLCLASDCVAALAYPGRQRPLSVFPICDPSQFVVQP